ncbi:MAG: TadE/TadG family type IV pilus assembly protein [Marmoricola sp.]
MFRRMRREERGASAVEFALVMLPLFYLVFGIIQYGLYFYARETGTQAVGDAVRRLSVGDCQTSGELRTLVANRLGNATSTPAANLILMQVFKKQDGTSDAAPGSPGGSVQLTVTFSSINMHFPFIPIPANGSISSTVFNRVEDVTASTNGCTP